MIEKHQTTRELVELFLKKLEERVKLNNTNPLAWEMKEFKPTL